MAWFRLISRISKSFCDREKFAYRSVYSYQIPTRLISKISKSFRDREKSAYESPDWTTPKEKRLPGRVDLSSFSLGECLLERCTFPGNLRALRHLRKWIPMLTAKVNLRRKTESAYTPNFRDGGKMLSSLALVARTNGLRGLVPRPDCNAHVPVRAAVGWVVQLKPESGVIRIGSSCVRRASFPEEGELQRVLPTDETLI